MTADEKLPRLAFCLLTFAVCLIYFLVCVVFFIGQMEEARRFPLWQDEIFGLACCVQAPVVDLIVKGAGGQASPAPLFYLLLKPIIFIREKFFQHWEPAVYFRLFNISVTTATPWALLFIF